MFNIDVSTREFAGHGVVALGGKLDASEAPGIASYLITAAAVYGPSFIVDLARVESIDSAGLGVLLSALRRTRRSGGDLPLAAPQDAVHRILTATGLISVFSVYPSVELAARESGPADGVEVAQSLGV
jgi:anti-sigma B factor antagonist